MSGLKEGAGWREPEKSVGVTLRDLVFEGQGGMFEGLEGGSVVGEMSERRWPTKGVVCALERGETGAGLLCAREEPNVDCARF